MKKVSGMGENFALTERGVSVPLGYYGEIHVVEGAEGEQKSK